MKLSKWITAGTLALSLSSLSIATADEMWDTEIGMVYYLGEIDGFAVLAYPTGDDGTEGKAYIEHLAGNFEDRVGAFDGYWVEANDADAPLCPVSILDAHGVQTNNWGRLTLVFTETAFPSGWVALRGDCFDTPSSPLTGKPSYGNVEDTSNIAATTEEE